MSKQIERIIGNAECRSVQVSTRGIHSSIVSSRFNLRITRETLLERGFQAVNEAYINDTRARIHARALNAGANSLHLHG